MRYIAVYIAAVIIWAALSESKESGLHMAATAPTTYSAYKNLKQEAMNNCAGDVSCYEMSKP